MHGGLIGWDTKSAKCSDCHGAHDILGVNNPNSHVGFNQVVKTCQKCHPDANRRFTGYLTHATHHDKAKYPILYVTFWGMTSLLLGTFGFFGLHTLCGPRSFAHMRAKRKMETAGHESIISGSSISSASPIWSSSSASWGWRDRDGLEICGHT
jgi:hypothetical protein